MAQRSALLLIVVSGLCSTALGAQAAPPAAPIAVEIGARAERHRSFLDNLLSSQDDTDLSEADVERALREWRWIETVTRDGEVVVDVTRRSIAESSRSQVKDGKLSIIWRYTVRAAIRTRGDRDVLEATTTSSETVTEREAARTRRESYGDRHTFERLGREIADKAADWILDHLDDLRPDRPDAGFRYEQKHKWLLKGDGLEVTAVLAGSPAWRAGLQVGDRIRAIDAEKGTAEMHLRARTWWFDAPGRGVMLEVERDKSRRQIECAILSPLDWEGGRAESAAEDSTARPTAGDTAVRPPEPGDRRPEKIDIKPGMRPQEVERALGRPTRVVSFASKTVWTYDGFSVVFVDGQVTDVQ